MRRLPPKSYAARSSLPSNVYRYDITDKLFRPNSFDSKKERLSSVNVRCDLQ